ncbi:tetratricopeptide repeat protein [Synechococcus elongatus]|uniref:Tetratricopeptide repeat protein n=1 Tax=Synechococcus elongatus PCC 11801 TaxID=2219813 RepID=A0AAN1UUU6_SYNEL|nr:tetratricopeptide repeat protein [Synechococcus elongatus]AZB72949.1 tetratricopeptide repeat protein [Synechococcus elongatus PCC 11801]
MAASDRKGRIAKLLLVYVSGIAFIGTSAVGIVGALQSSWQASQESETAGLVSADLLKQIQGYRNVVEREPNNRFALEQLVQLELQLGRKTTAQEYLDRLLKLDPQNSAYQSLQQQLAQK